MNEHESIEEKLLGMVRDGIDAAVLLSRSSVVEAGAAGEDKLKELAGAVETAANALDEAMISLLDAETDDEDEDEN